MWSLSIPLLYSSPYFMFKLKTIRNQGCPAIVMLAKVYSTKTSGQRAGGQKMEIACFHISATFWLLKIIVFCVYVCTKHINIQLYWNIIRENTPPHTTYSNQTDTRENRAENKNFTRKNIFSRILDFTDRSTINKPLLDTLAIKHKSLQQMFWFHFDWK